MARRSTKEVGLNNFKTRTFSSRIRSRVLGFGLWFHRSPVTLPDSVRRWQKAVSQPALSTFARTMSGRLLVPCPNVIAVRLDRCDNVSDRWSSG